MNCFAVTKIVFCDASEKVIFEDAPVWASLKNDARLLPKCKRRAFMSVALIFSDAVSVS